MLALPAAIPGRGVEEADARIPGGGQRSLGIGFADADEQIAERRATEAELRERQGGAAKASAEEGLHGSFSVGGVRQSTARRHERQTVQSST